MNTTLFFIIFASVIFVVAICAIAFFHKDAIFTLAIGAVIGANVYNVGSYPLEISGMVFGMDSIIYTIFLFCMFLMLANYGKKSLRLVLYTALFSIFFTALLAFFGTYMKTGGFSHEQIWNALSYVFSILATYVCVLCMGLMYRKLKQSNANKYLTIIVCMAIGSVVNSIIYFGLTLILNGTLGETFYLTIIGSILAKLGAILICAVLYYFNEKYWHPKYLLKHPELQRININLNNKKNNLKKLKK